MRNKFLFISIIVAIIGCNESTMLFAAKENIYAYTNVNDYPNKVAFIIPAGTVCEMGKTVIGKVDAYTEIRCPSYHGWILTMMKDNFEPIQ
jgi:hypothetical protein